MTPTSDERREVAERLRKAADSDEWLDVAINNAIFGVFGESYSRHTSRPHRPDVYKRAG